MLISTSIIRQGRTGTFRHLAFAHPCLIVVREGAKVVELEGRRLEAGVGKAVALSGGVKADVSNITEPGGIYRADVFSFSPALFETVKDAGYGCLPVTAPFDACLSSVRALVDDPGCMPEPIVRHRVEEVFVWLAAAGITLSMAPARTLSARVRARIEADPAHKWRLGDMLALLAADGEAMSEATFRRRLAAENTSLTDILADTRLSRALGQLQTGTASIMRVALDAGYDSPSRFAIRFRARFGCPPSHIRASSRRIERNGTEFERIGVETPFFPGAGWSPSE